MAGRSAPGGHEHRAGARLAEINVLGRERLSKAETVTVAALEAGLPALVEARELIACFQAMIRHKTVTTLGLSAPAQVSSPPSRTASQMMWPQFTPRSPCPGQTARPRARSRAKLVKRQMYGRGKLDLLQARLIGVQ